MNRLLWLFVLLAVFALQCAPKRDRHSTAHKPSVERAVSKMYPIDSTNAPVVIPIAKENVSSKSAVAAKITKFPYANGLGLPRFSRLSSADGLVPGPYSALFFDRSGSLWLGGTEGVSRYDGTNITNYTVANGLVNGFVVGIAEDETGDLWFATRGGLSKFDGYSFTNYTEDDGLVGGTILCLLLDRTGQLWIGSTLGLSRFDYRNIKQAGPVIRNMNIDAGVDFSTVSDLFEDQSGTIWVAAESGLGSFGENGFTPVSNEHGLTIDDIVSIEQDDSRSMWFGTSSRGVVKYDGHTMINYTTRDGLAANTIGSSMKDSQGNVWFSTKGIGVSVFDGNSFRSFSSKEGLGMDFVYSIAEEPGGSIWFGLIRGVSKMDGMAVTVYDALQGIPEKLVFNIIADREDNYWFASYAGLLRFDGKTIVQISEETPWFIVEDRRGNIWYTSNGLVKYDGQTLTRYTDPRGLPFAFDFNDDFVEDRSGNLWVVGNEGLSKFDGQTLTYYQSGKSLQDAIGNSRAIAADKQGNLWFTSQQALTRFDGSVFTVFKTNDASFKLRRDFSNIIEDGLGNIWMASSKGLTRFDGSNFTHFTTLDGLGHSEIWAIAQDTVSNIIWLGTIKGLTALKMGVDSAGNQQINSIENFDRQNGFPVSHINPTSLFVDRHGVVWCGNIENEIIRFDYKQLQQKRRPYDLHITDIRLNNERVLWSVMENREAGNGSMDSLLRVNEAMLRFGADPDRTLIFGMQEKYEGIFFDSLSPFSLVPHNLEIPYGANDVTISFAATYPSFGRFAWYQYKMEGYDDNWSALSEATSARFGNMREGSYTLLLKAVDPLGVWSETSYSFKVLPPWWRSWWAYLVYGLSGIAVIALSIRLRTKKLREEKMLLEEKVTERTAQLQQKSTALERSLHDLKSTQTQLIQSEKMASLGELTAGIAHEIQNPLNFINNFSEINTELIEELTQLILAGNMDEARVIAQSITENEQKILHHGQRADAIVKNMLYHSRASSGVREPTDLNSLADEYLRLAYHGSRAKDKSFNATVKTNFDPALGKIEVVGQDLGRVILNLVNNAFYAVRVKKEKLNGDYEPTVSVDTRRENGKIYVQISDNGMGIPEAIKQKIFQPFFTTKPAGQGTGLGLSLSYDIVKAQGGNLKVESEEGVGSVFVIELPAS
jgi:signal transduction histidine kinase/ligand-binding sensor domain-containing protein